MDIARQGAGAKVRTDIQEGEYELAVAWVNGEINTSQVKAAYRSAGIGYSDGSVAHRIGSTLRAGVDKGLIKVILK